jgi:heme/copper-type cytochrome/quinol oxidase subunit 2
MKLLRKLLMVAALAVASPSPLFACAACYGRTDSPLAEGMNWGIFTLLGVVLTVLSGVLAFFVHIVRKEEALNPETTRKDAPDV